MATSTYYEPPTVMTALPDIEITSDVLTKYIKMHKAEVERYQMLRDMYIGNHPIVKQDSKDASKPDARIVVNFAKYIVDTFNGYFMGKSVTVSHDDETISGLVNDFLKRNDQDDNNSELSKLVRIYGRAYEFLWQDEDAITHVTYNSPLDMFMVYDNSIAQRPLFAVRYYVVNDEDDPDNGKERGEVYTAEKVINFHAGDGGYQFLDETPVYYGRVPVIEYINNDERQGIFEPVISMINAYDSALSEKDNDVAYFADAYLAVLGIKLDKDGIKKIRDNRVINLFGTEDPEAIKNIVVKYLDKPNADGTQEHLLDRLEKLIYQMAMVTNLSSEDLGNASGVGLEFKLEEMENLALTAERKMRSGFNQRFKMWFSLPTNVPATQRDEWFNLKYAFHRNIPHDTLSEVQKAQAAAGLLPLEDRIAMISGIDDPKATAAKMQEESGGELTDDFSRTAGEVDGTSEDE